MLYILLLALLLFPAITHAQIPSGCHLITAEERAALALREVNLPTTGFFCDADRAILFGSCTSDPLPILMSHKALGPTCSRDGDRAITKLNPEFACRLSRYVTAHPATTITCGWRSYETQQILHNQFLAGTGSPANRPGTSKHETGLAADLGGVTEAARLAATQFALVYTVGNEPWHIEGIGITADPPATVNTSPPTLTGQTAPPLIQTAPLVSTPSPLLNMQTLNTLAYSAYLLSTLLNSYSTPIPNQTQAQQPITYDLPFPASTGTTPATSPVADALLAALYGSSTPAVATMSTTALATLTSVLATASSTEEDSEIRALMLYAIELMRELIRLLTEVVGAQTT